MKIDVMPSIVQMDPEVLKNLVKEVKERVAQDIQLPQKASPSFGINDLWNIRRKAKTSRSFLGR